MPTYIKELPTQEWLLDRFCIIDNFVCWKDKKISRGRDSQKVNKKVNHWLDNSGYYRVIIDKRKYQMARIIYQMVYGDLTADYVVDHIDKNKINNSIENLRKVSHKLNVRNKSRQSNTKDSVGVNFTRKKHPNSEKYSDYYAARWVDIDGVQRNKCFSIDKLGKDNAYQLAVEYRKKMIYELNAQGAGYTEHHGI